MASAAWAGETIYPSTSVDPRIELLAVVHVLACSTTALPGFTLDRSAYAKDIRETFGRYQGHAAVAAYAAAARGGLGPIEAEKLVLRRDRPEYAGLLSALDSFRADSGFDRFYDAHREFYNAQLDSFLVGLSQAREMDVMRRYTGMPVASAYKIILSPLADGAGDLSDIRCIGGGPSHDIVSLFGPDRARKEPFAYSGGHRWHIWHELGHAALDRRLEDFPGEVAATAGLRDSAPGCYQSWAQCIRENVAQGLATRLLEVSTEPAVVAWSPKREEGRTPFAAAVAERLKEYESDRARYQRLTDFYPRLLALFLEKSGSPTLPAHAPSVEAPASCPALPAAEPPGEAEKLTAQAGELLAAGRAPEAWTKLKRARALSPNDPGVALSECVVLLELGHPSQAMTAADRAVALASKKGEAGRLMSAEALSTRSSVWEKLERKGEALNDLEQALRLAPPGWPRRAETEKRRDALRGT